MKEGEGVERGDGEGEGVRDNEEEEVRPGICKHNIQTKFIMCVQCIALLISSGASPPPVSNLSPCL